ncbi:hypothetical protein A2853_00910 [Candidatus Kaiserbacteria bacterium RIFCSPHIGHO2_01_FULL_55_17]|uniref:Uncharacterized protein n=1 Tax=Candidatus Kaiserbacteria bacterium RIFCSPHIGHO2_01_FULL_55_17 TaxID=1798484 RepID=A0A1F6D9D0_9BACT|nr:MAG: hypothetical protein A2853_00910 [Candidatus Kaiserbacteria bacterium RIFCSPHIGHO2_01_FULL_55_17]
MAIKDTVGSLKERPKDEKKAIAGGIAIAVVVVLLAGWAILFFKKIQRGAELQQLGSGAQEEFDFQSVRDAQQELMQSFSDTNELLEARDQSAQQYQPMPTYQDNSNGAEPFGGEGGIQ